MLDSATVTKIETQNLPRSLRSAEQSDCTVEGKVTTSRLVSKTWSRCFMYQCHRSAVRNVYEILPHTNAKELAPSTPAKMFCASLRKSSRTKLYLNHRRHSLIRHLNTQRKGWYTLSKFV